MHPLQPKKYQKKKYTVFKNGLYHTVPLSKDSIPSYYLGTHFINDATWECKETCIKYIKHSINCYWDGFVIKAKKLITVGEELKLDYDDNQYKKAITNLN